MRNFYGYFKPLFEFLSQHLSSISIEQIFLGIGSGISFFYRRQLILKVSENIGFMVVMKFCKDLIKVNKLRLVKAIFTDSKRLVFSELLILKSFFKEYIWFFPILLPLSFILGEMFDFILVDVIIPGHFAALDTAIPKELKAAVDIAAEHYSRSDSFETTPDVAKKNKYLFLLTTVVTFTLTAFYFSC